MTVEELFGTLQQAVVGSWRKHLRTAKYGKHEALDEFYKEMPEKVDALIEAWMGANGKKIGSFENLLKSANYNTLSYLKELKKICKQGYSILDDNDELKSLLDDIVNLINSTLYKVKELSESSVIDLKDYLMESLVEESCEYDYDAKRFNPKDCLTWLIKTKLLDKYSDSKYDAEEWAELAQAAAEEAGLPLDAAERVYDAAYYLNEALVNETKKYKVDDYAHINDKRLNPMWLDDAESGEEHKYEFLPNTPKIVKAAVNPVKIGKYWIAFDNVDDQIETMEKLGYDPENNGVFDEAYWDPEYNELLKILKADGCNC